MSKVKRTNGIIDRIKFMALKHYLFFTERDLCVCVFVCVCVCVCVRERERERESEITGIIIKLKVNKSVYLNSSFHVL